MSYIINQSIEKFIILVNILYLLLFKRYAWRIFIIKKCWWWAISFATELKNLDKDKETIEKRFFLNNLGLFFIATEKVHNNFKSGLFRIKNLDKIPPHERTPELATEPTKRKKSKLNWNKNLWMKLYLPRKK